MLPIKRQKQLENGATKGENERGECCVSYVVTARYEDDKVWEVEEEFQSHEEAEKMIKYLKKYVLADAKWEITPK